MSESFIQDIGNEIIKKVKALLKNESEDLFKNIYKKKFEEFKNWINNNYLKNNNNIYNSLINTSFVQENINEFNNKKNEYNSSLNKLSERSGRTSNKNISKIKASGINVSTLTGNNYDKKSENKTSLSNRSEKQENISKNNISIIGTPEGNLKASINTLNGNNCIKKSENTFNAIEKPEEKESDNPLDNIKGPDIYL